jgi:hypothetical protein
MMGCTAFERAPRPGDRDLRCARSHFASDLVDAAGHGQVAFGERPGRDPGSGPWPTLARELAGEDGRLRAATRRRRSCRTRVHREKLSFEVALQEAVWRLERCEWGPTVLGRKGVGVGDDPRRRV